MGSKFKYLVLFPVFFTTANSYAGDQIINTSRYTQEYKLRNKKEFRFSVDKIQINRPSIDVRFSYGRDIVISNKVDFFSNSYQLSYDHFFDDFLLSTKLRIPNFEKPSDSLEAQLDLSYLIDKRSSISSKISYIHSIPGVTSIDFSYTYKF
ncbi:MAG: hypothetical protein VXZ40_02475 [Nanoarchaeota archaeon]|nr:hypothetical protein [Nanoarchaeota archaeon]